MERFARLTHQRLAAKKGGLTGSQIFILRFLEPRDFAKASDLARVSGLSPGAVTQVCDELVKEGYVERTRSQDDRRVVHISITPPGREMLDQLVAERRAHIRWIFEQLGAEDATEFVRIVRRIVDLLEREVGGGDDRDGTDAPSHPVTSDGGRG